MPIVPPKNKVIALKHETLIEIVNRVHLQPDNVKVSIPPAPAIG